MRRWVCIVALLAGFTRSEYAWTVRPRIPIPVERPIEPRPDRHGTLQTGDWWRTA